MNVILNPQYGIRNEKNCSYLCLLDNSLDTVIHNIPSFLVIPPLYAYILSSFTGESLEKTVQEIYNKTKLNKDAILKFVTQLIGHESFLEINYKEIKIVFPPNLLLSSDISNKKNKIKVVTETDTFHPLNVFVPSRPSMPLSVSIMLTSKCKTDCVYCYADRNVKVDFNLEKVLSLLDECYFSGVLTVGLSGGDIFAYKNWKEVIERMYYHGYSSFLSTKIPLDAASISFLSKHGIKEIQFSLDSVVKEELKIMIKQDIDYTDKIKDMLSACKENNIKVIIKTVITKYNSNVSNLRLLYETLAKYSVNTWNVFPAFFSQYKGCYEDYRALNESLKKCYYYLKQLQNHSDMRILYERLQDKTVISPKYNNTIEFVTQNKGCIITSFSISINVFGQVALCEMLYNHKDFHLGNIHKKTIKDIWQSEKMRYFNEFKILGLKVNEDSSCYSCKEIEQCKFGNVKKVCIVDIVTAYGVDKWDFPDPRCPKAPECNMDLLLI